MYPSTFRVIFSSRNSFRPERGIRCAPVHVEPDGTNSAFPLLLTALIYITTASGATLGFPGFLAIGSKGLLGLAAPMDAAGKFVIFLAVSLVVHFLVAQMATGCLKSGR